MHSIFQLNNLPIEMLRSFEQYDSALSFEFGWIRFVCVKIQGYLVHNPLKS